MQREYIQSVMHIPKNLQESTCQKGFGRKPKIENLIYFDLTRTSVVPNLLSEIEDSFRTIYWIWKNC